MGGGQVLLKLRNLNKSIRGSPICRTEKAVSLMGGVGVLGSWVPPEHLLSPGSDAVRNL